MVVDTGPRAAVPPREVTLDLAAARSTSVIASMIRHGMTYEAEVTSLLVHLFSEPRRGLFIDVGSHIGLFPLLLAKVGATSRPRRDVELFAHEPLRKLRRISMELQVANGVRFAVDPVAVGDRQGPADFYVSAVSDSSGSLIAGFRAARKVVRVDVRTLDSLYLKRVATRRPDVFVLLVDAEAAEPAVLRGGRRLLERHRPIVICEVLADRTEDQIVAALDGLDYTMYRYDGERWRQERTLVGDPSYRFRDWCFIPAERADAFGAAFSVPEHVSVRYALT